MSSTINIGGRRSKLAVVQSNQVKTLIESLDPSLSCTITALQTLGDQVQSKPLYSFGGKSLWTKELEDKLISGDIHLIVHSLKDLPTILPSGFQLGCITKREDPSDCLVISKEFTSSYHSIDQFPPGSVIGTSSIRRSAQLAKRFPNLIFRDIRGNIQTRLNTLDDPKTPFKGIVLASAGLIRLHLQDRISQKFDSQIMYHAVGQGALGIEIKENDTRMLSILNKIQDLPTTICCIAERSLLRTLEGGCSLPIGVESIYDSKTGNLVLKSIVLSIDGKESVEAQHEQTIQPSTYSQDAAQCGQQLAQILVSKGAQKILDQINL